MHSPQPTVARSDLGGQGSQGQDYDASPPSRGAGGPACGELLHTWQRSHRDHRVTSREPWILESPSRGIPGVAAPLTDATKNVASKVRRVAALGQRSVFPCSLFWFPRAYCVAG